jgi:3-phosphoshikimate 1-carboxyvinyltransferase
LVGGKNITIDGSSSSQLLTGLLIALPFLDVVNTIVNVKNPTSIPYIDLTLSTLQKVGVTIHNDNYIQFIIPGRQKIQSVNTTIEGDWSGAAFFLVAGAIAGNISVKGLNLNSKQADKEILTVLKLADAQINISDSEINVSKSKLKAFKFDATNCPDLFPPLAVLSAFCEGTSVILGANRLIDKESNRIESLINVFKLLGITIVVENNLMSITGGVVKGGRVSSHNDHRIAMAAAILALGAEKAVIIDDHEAVRKSFPEFFKLLSQIQINK